MRIAAFGATLLFAFAACSTSAPQTNDDYQHPNSLMAGEIDRRIEQIPFQHRDELVQNLTWLAQTGEQTIPALMKGLRSDAPKVRSSCAYVLGRIGDRRVIPTLQSAMKDQDQIVRMEVARTLVLLGDLQWSPQLIEGLDSDRKEVRYLCHEALKSSTGHDFGYDHLNQNQTEMKTAILHWRQWWSDYSGDVYFAQSYQQQNHLEAVPAVPMGETKTEIPSTNGQPSNSQPTNPPAGRAVTGSSMPGTEGGAAASGIENTTTPAGNGTTQPEPR